MRNWVKGLRVKNGLTQKELGRKLGISESYYCAIEKGYRQKNMDMLLAAGISAVFGIPVADIVEMEQQWKHGQA